jgi:FAD/FMN-containing dehydrogenase
VKKLQTLILSIVIVNAVAIVGFSGWLLYTGRIDRERVQKVREIFKETVDQEKVRIEIETSQKEEANRASAVGAPGRPPRAASELVAMRLEATDVDRQRIERMRREVQDLQRKLRRDQTVLDIQASSFQENRDAFNAMRERLAEIEGHEQFKKTVDLLNSLKSNETMSILVVLIAEKKQEQVVSYLNALEERSRTRVFAEFIKDGQQELASDLLESLRLRGLEAGVDGEKIDDSSG